MNIVILGPQGSGKGTQAELIAEYFGLKHIDMGARLRELEHEESSRGAAIRSSIDQGDLIDLELSIEIFTELIGDGENLVIEGFPRTLEQYSAIADQISFDHAILIDVPQHVSIARIVERARIQHREDDTPETVQRRLQIYHAQTEMLLREYTDRGILITIDGNRSREEVFNDIRDAIERSAL